MTCIIPLPLTPAYGARIRLCHLYFLLIHCLCYDIYYDIYYDICYDIYYDIVNLSYNPTAISIEPASLD